MLGSIAPLLPVFNLENTNLFYRDKLNFEISYAGNYLVAARDGIRIYFTELRDKRNFVPSTCFIFVKNIEDIYAYFSSINMILPDDRLRELTGRIKEFTIRDINGHELRFTELPY